MSNSKKTLAEHASTIWTSILAPLGQYPLTILFLVFLLTIPRVFCYETISGLLIGIVQDFAILYLLYTLCYLLRRNNTLSKGTDIAIHTVVYIIAFLTITIFCLSDTVFFMELLLIVYETSVEEALDFVSFYRVMVITTMIVVIGVLLLGRFLRKKNPVVGEKIKSWKNPWKTVVPVLTLCSIMTLPLYGEGSLGNFKHQLGGFARYLKDIASVDKANANLQNDSCSYTSSNIVLIIGESHNKHHSSLYGYKLPTNPFLSKQKNLYVFDNVISPINYTMGAFNHFLSLSSVDQETEWFESPLFPCLFRASDYNVLLWENQTASCSYIRSGNLDFYNEKNTLQYDYDEDIVKDFVKARPTVEKEKNNLIIFHLIGQHFDYKSRFPKERNLFTAKDYDRKELSSSQIQTLADYDNATRYNDSIVSKIIRLYQDKDAIVLYFSDHGEEIYDFRDCSGRNAFDENNMSAWMHCEVEIPFLIYVSDLYKEKHPEIVSRIERSVHRPFMTDDLPHLMFELAGIKNKWYDPKRSLINDSFDTTRQRLVNDWGAVLVNYDSICDPKEEWSIGW
ncbi:MAG: phosphoethanolamine transferase [Paludibacteraceae bacterium]|nr:phosphoethanolamine transferase [Paludibacteraceae bacterium]